MLVSRLWVSSFSGARGYSLFIVLGHLIFLLIFSTRILTDDNKTTIMSGDGKEERRKQPQQSIGPIYTVGSL